MNISQYAPVVLFVFNRLDHAKQTIESLKKNKFSDKTDLFIYCDNYLKIKDEEDVRKVKDFVYTVTGFKSISIIEREQNYGLAKSIKEGVSSVIESYGKVIVLEDDIVTSPFFLSYMNKALQIYANEERVMHISGFNYPINNSEFESSYFSSMSACWGWATWKRAWDKFENNIELLENKITEKGKDKFIVSSNFTYWEQLILNKKKKLKTWFIYWYGTIYINNGLCLYPKSTYTQNIGLDGTGTNSQNGNVYYSELNTRDIDFFPSKIEEFENSNNSFKEFFDRVEKSKFEKYIINLVIKIFGLEGYKKVKKVISK
ncbi:GNT-I family protein [Lutibacter oricola]|uniref:GNT-I family protein n=1 Tax=Lutibacter oricola TaxID=762486 RepID=A0A1H2TPL8_9FLAO|nr:hypothetical protein [Lutibacter oricola]SDW45727.1 GNT-I family protein [Lutibacter oricola]